ncbi:unannotated protein [freshwater metagenome]|uniref:Unannotated protein n=1 Tax=freshwater metagenome TaxID=449393 RepID=A0A6J6Q686_9ZZZZ
MARCGDGNNERQETRCHNAHEAHAIAEDLVKTNDRNMGVAIETAGRQTVGDEQVERSEQQEQQRKAGKQEQL